MDREKVIKGLECCSIPQGHCGKCPYETEDSITECTSELAKDVIALLKEQETVEHALDVLRKNGWKEEGTCEKCPLLTAVSDGVHDMAKQFRKEG